MKKVSNWIADFLVKNKLEHAFSLVGGGAMHLNDAFGKEPELEVIYNHHEQACAMAAESYARLTGKLAVVCVTTGPGGINALNGVFGAWTDSIPMIVISGQVKYETTVRSAGLNLRQLGDQECDIIKMVESITKYSAMVTDPNMIKYHLEKALFLANSGRKGPVWLDIPMDIQGAYIDPNNLVSFYPNTPNAKEFPGIPTVSLNQVDNVFYLLREAKRPVIMVGSGVRISKQEQNILSIVKLLNIPVVTAWNSHDLIPNDHPCYIGRPGTVGDRAGNFAVQRADFLLVLGSRLNIRQIGYNWTAFAKRAFIVLVDIDLQELHKPTLKIDLPIHADLKDFCNKLSVIIKRNNTLKKERWLNWCLDRRKKYPVVLDKYWKTKNLVNPYCFMHNLSDLLPEGAITVSGDGTACVTSFQAMQIKPGQRLYTNSGCASMGYDLPAAIGACVGSGGKQIICLAGDGSIQQNIQELATIAYYKYNIKIFVLNNNGYHSIRQTQSNFFGKPYVGCGPESGVGLPSMGKIANAYGFTYYKLSSHDKMNETIKNSISESGPLICEVFIDQEQEFAPKSASFVNSDGKILSAELDNLKPFLGVEEIEENKCEIF